MSLLGDGNAGYAFLDQLRKKSYRMEFVLIFKFTGQKFFISKFFVVHENCHKRFRSNTFDVYFTEIVQSLKLVSFLDLIVTLSLHTKRLRRKSVDHCPTFSFMNSV